MTCAGHSYRAPQTRQQSRTKLSQPTQTKDHTNDRVGFDISLNRNLIAAATDDNINATVQTFDAGTGDEVYTCKFYDDSEGIPATCVRFVDDDLELLMANGKRVESVAWGGSKSD